MKILFRAAAVVVAILGVSAAMTSCGGAEGVSQKSAVATAKSMTVGVCEANPHYLTYKGEPTLLVTSAEHYGAVLNPAFDYLKYLDQLVKDGMNYTRIFSGGAYWEGEGDFGITNNTLAPEPGTALVPWAKSDVDGANGGGKKYDLDRWNEPYFERLHAFVTAAAERDIVVEMTLFTSIYRQESWLRSPFNPTNNINAMTYDDFLTVHTLADAKINAYQRRLVERLVEELNDYDNLFFEIQNEPWADQPVARPCTDMWGDKLMARWQSRIDLPTEASMDWHEAVAGWIYDKESTLAKRHLVAMCYANFACTIHRLPKHVSMVNFHYAWPEAVHLNYGYEMPICFDESGFSGKDDATYRQQAWSFLMAGGAMVNNLDYSFAVGHEQGDLIHPAPGGGSPALRSQICALRTWFEEMPFTRMSADHSVLSLVPGGRGIAFSDHVDLWAIYLYRHPVPWVQLSLPADNYEIAWYDPSTAKLLAKEPFQVLADDPFVRLTPPSYTTDIAARITTR